MCVCLSSKILRNVLSSMYRYYIQVLHIDFPDVSSVQIKKPTKITYEEIPSYLSGKTLIYRIKFSANYNMVFQ